MEYRAPPCYGRSIMAQNQSGERPVLYRIPFVVGVVSLGIIGIGWAKGCHTNGLAISESAPLSRRAAAAEFSDRFAPTSEQLRRRLIALGVAPGKAESLVKDIHLVVTATFEGNWQVYAGSMRGRGLELNKAAPAFAEYLETSLRYPAGALELNGPVVRRFNENDALALRQRSTEEQLEYMWRHTEQRDLAIANWNPESVDVGLGLKMKKGYWGFNNTYGISDQ